MSSNTDAKPLNDRDSFPKKLPEADSPLRKLFPYPDEPVRQISPTETKSAYETHEALAFIHRVERDNAEEFAGELAEDLRKMRQRAERAEEMLTVERERCALVALEQRCERGTAWDLACVEIARAIMRPTAYEQGK